VKIRVWAFIIGVVALAGIASGLLLTVQILGPHGRRPRYGAAATPKRHPGAESLR
jgi:hypothetical protein